jgi:UDP-GlcNAc:undecaprenyl-phosphate/decaprenyl-phosphate GlcNAc-1-phosphate transferase
MNSLNMLDNMDGITTIVSLSVITSAVVILLTRHDILNIDFALLIGVAGALIGFLVYNWHPSRMYMGDTGSQFIGFFLAAIGIKYFWNNEDIIVRVPSRQLVSVLVVFALPITDTLTVVINRISKGKSPFVGGKDHTTHHLGYLGYTDRQVALIFVILSLTTITVTYIIFHIIEHWSHVYTAIFSAYFLLIAGTLFYITRRNQGRMKDLK